MKREKRNAKVQGYIPASLYEQLELFATQDNVRSMSDFLHRALDEYASVRIARQNPTRYARNR